MPSQAKKMKFPIAPPISKSNRRLLEVKEYRKDLYVGEKSLSNITDRESSGAFRNQIGDGRKPETIPTQIRLNKVRRKAESVG